MSVWISVKDRLPSLETPVLVLLKGTYCGEATRVIYCGYYTGDGWITYNCGNRTFLTSANIRATHWMPLPGLPKEGE